MSNRPDSKAIFERAEDEQAITAAGDSSCRVSDSGKAHSGNAHRAGSYDSPCSGGSDASLNSKQLIETLKTLGYFAQVEFDADADGRVIANGDNIDSKGLSNSSEESRHFSLLIKVGISVDQFCDFLRARGVDIQNRAGRDAASTSSNWGIARVAIQTEAGSVLLLDGIKAFRDAYMIAFDLDGTLVDTTESFDTTVSELVERHSGRPLPAEELKSLRAEGGFNNNWDAAVELIRRRGKTLSRKELDPEALKIYFALAQEKEKLLVDLKVLETLAKRHPLYILTGRCQFEYKPVWESRLGTSFARVYCLDDLPHCKPKPAADSLQEMLRNHNATTGVYVGNAYDDMWAARAAGMHAIAVTTTHSASDLIQAGAQLTYDMPDQLLEAFLL